MKLSLCCGAEPVSETDFCSRCRDHTGFEEVCPEFLEPRPNDDRVEAGVLLGRQCQGGDGLGQVARFADGLHLADETPRPRGGPDLQDEVPGSGSGRLLFGHPEGGKQLWEPPAQIREHFPLRRHSFT